MDSARSAATDSASDALLLRLGHAAPILFVLSVHHFGVVAASVQRIGVNVLAGILICTVFSPVSFFVVSGVFEVLFHDKFSTSAMDSLFYRRLLLIAASLVFLVSVLPYLQSQMNLVAATIHLITCSFWTLSLSRLAMRTFAAAGLWGSWDALPP